MTLNIPLCLSKTMVWSGAWFYLGLAFQRSDCTACLWPIATVWCQLNGLENREAAAQELAIGDPDAQKGAPLLLELIKRNKQKEKPCVSSEVNPPRSPLHTQYVALCSCAALLRMSLPFASLLNYPLILILIRLVSLILLTCLYQFSSF